MLLLLLGCVPGQSLLVISPDVFSIILLLDCEPGVSLLVISPDVFPYNSAVRLCTRSMTFGDFARGSLQIKVIIIRHWVDHFW